MMMLVGFYQQFAVFGKIGATHVDINRPTAIFKLGLIDTAIFMFFIFGVLL